MRVCIGLVSCILFASLFTVCKLNSSQIAEKIDADADSLVGKLILENEEWPHTRKYLRNGIDEGGIPIRVSATSSFGANESRMLVFVLSHESHNGHCIVVANHLYQIVDHRVGHGYVESIKWILEDNPFVSELIVGTDLPCHYAFSKNGEIETIFASRVGLMNEGQATAQRNYLKSFSWIAKETENEVETKGRSLIAD